MTSAQRKMFNLNKKKMILWLILIVILAVLVKWIFFASEERPTFITAPVLKQTIEYTVLADGVIKPAKLLSVGAQVSGQIKQLNVKIGDHVVKGELIAEIDDLTQRNALKEANASLASLQAQLQAKEADLKNAQLTYDRQKKLVSTKAGAQYALDEAEATLENVKASINSLHADIERAEVSVDTAKLNLGYTQITAPMDGIVVAIPVEEGQTVNAVQSAPTIVKIAQLDKMTVEAEISEADVVKIDEENSDVYFTILGLPNRKFDGLKLSSIKPGPESISDDDYLTSTTSSSGTAIYYKGLFDVDNSDGILRPSMTAQVYIILERAENALTIPATAIQKSLPNNEAVVFKLVNDRPERVVIKTGINNNVRVEVLSGLSEGDKVIVGNIDLPVKAKNSSTTLPRTPRR